MLSLTKSLVRVGATIKNLFLPQRFKAPVNCPYLLGQIRQDKFFVASAVSAKELDKLLSEGWRKFGPYYFQPSCPLCNACTPLRVPVDKFKPNRNQKRTLRKGQELNVSFGPLNFSPKVFELFRDHRDVRFGKKNHNLEQFMHKFYTPSCPGLQVSVTLAGELVGVGWLDRGDVSLSSVYFCFDPQYSHLNLGTYTILAELDYARERGLQWHYLGYCISGNRSTAYKANFKPYEIMDWSTGEWREV